LKKLKITDFTFANLPEPVSSELYQDARDWLISYLLKRKDVVSLYEFGSVGMPGISDLDLCVVIDDKPQPGIAAYLQPDNFDPLLRNLLVGGTVMVMRREDFSRIRIWDDINLVHRYGERIDSPAPADTELTCVELCRLVDWLPERMARLAGYSQMRVLPVRRVLGVLHSLSYSLERLHKVTGRVEPRIERFLKAAHSLRLRWFEMPGNRDGDLLACLQEGISVGFEAINLLADYIQGCRFYFAEDAPEHAELRLGDGLLLVFDSGHSKNNIDRSLELSTQGLSAVILPSVFYQHFAAYGLIGGLIGEQIVKNLEPKPGRECLESVDPGLRKVLKRRMELCNRMAAFLARFGFKGGLFKFGWFYGAVLRQYQATGKSYVG